MSFAAHRPLRKRGLVALSHCSKCVAGMILALSATSISGCATLATPGARASAADGLAAQSALWNAGDMEGALASYCPSADITWVNKNGLTHGYESFAQFMRTEFAPDKGMGTLTNTVLESRNLPSGMTLVSLRWSLVRDGRRLMGGVSSQIWAECQGRLRIIFEHAS